MPPPGIDSASRSPPIRRRSPIAVDPSPMDVPSPSDEFLTQVDLQNIALTLAVCNRHSNDIFSAVCNTEPTDCPLLVAPRHSTTLDITVKKIFYNLQVMAIVAIYLIVVKQCVIKD